MAVATKAAKKDISTKMVTVPAPTKAEKALQVNTTELLAQANRCVVTTDDEAERATSLGSMIGDLFNKAEKERKELTEPLRLVTAKINERYKTNLTEPLERAKTIIKEKLGAYMREQRRIADEKAAKLLAQQQKAEAAGRTTRADNLAIAADTALAHAAAAGSTRGAVGGSSSLRKVLKFRVVDMAQVPREYLIVNETMVREMMRETAATAKADNIPLDKWATTTIPGIEFYEDDTVALR